jgi:hypothetical protein
MTLCVYLFQMTDRYESQGDKKTYPGKLTSRHGTAMEIGSGLDLGYAKIRFGK